MLRTPYEPICAVCVAKYVKLEDMWVTRGKVSQGALEFFEIPKGRHQTLENVRGKTFAVDALY